MRVYCLLLVVFAMMYHLVSAQNSSQKQLRAEQNVVACMLKENETLKTQFEASIRGLHGVQPNFFGSTRRNIGAVGSDTSITCKSFTESLCTGDHTEIIWCINLYHPSKEIEMCLNFTNGEINATDYARRLGINELLQLPLATSPQQSSLTISGSPYFLSNSVVTCTTQNLSCISKSFHFLNIRITNAALELSNVTVHNSTELLLGQTNIFLCTAEFQNSDSHNTGYCSWQFHDTSQNLTYADLYGCDPLEDFSDCFLGGDERIRFYTMGYNIRTCPRIIFLSYCWLVIENATEADAELAYECQAGFTAFNPSRHEVIRTVKHSLIPIYPALEIILMDTPSLPPGYIGPAIPTYNLKSGETLQWNCTVQAGEGDSLIWMLDEMVIPSSLDINTQQDLSCTLDSFGDVFVASHETVELGEFKRQFTSTLLLCQVTEHTIGTYQCAVNRTRGDNVEIIEVWSAKVQLSPNGSNTIIIGVTVGCSSALLVLIIVTTLILCCLRCTRQREQRKPDWTKDIFVTDDDVLHITGTGVTYKTSKNQALLMQSVDPLEFPRNKLVFLNTILGKGTFGVVLQAKAEDIVKSAPHRNIVAVKTTRDKAPPHEINNFWEELQLMKHMTPHNNVINLLGHCTTPGGPIYMIIEYARYGSLKDFLKECEQVVLQLNHVPQVMSYKSHQNSSTHSPCSTCSTYPQLVDRTQLNSYSGVFSPDNTSTPSTATTGQGMFQFPPTKQISMTRERLTTQDSGFGDYSPQAAFSDALGDDSLIAHSVAPLTHDYVNSKGLLYMEDVQNFALQIACGLKHLEESQIVHCDLAARNILIAEGFVLKIGDFGMARDVSEKEYYRKQGGRIPVKWTAPEALTDHIFTFKSDIWSFGIVLWEILTYGQQPYPKLKIRHSWEPFINYLMEGNRLAQPRGCPDSVYDVMQNCWYNSPDKRPTADELVQILSQKNLLVINKTSSDETAV